MNRFTFSSMTRRGFLYTATAGALATLGSCGRRERAAELLHASYDATRELYRKINRAFADHRHQQGQQPVRIKMSHGGSGAQARAVLDGLPAHVVSLALWLDIDILVQKGLIDPLWESHFPHRSLPYISTVVFVVRQGNPWNIRDWPDLLQDKLRIVTANPKTSGGARLNVLAAWLSVTARGGTFQDAKAYLKQLLRKVPVLDSGTRGAALTFARKGIGDVLLTWENEAYLQQRELRGQVEIVHPPLSVQAEPHVAVVQANVQHHGYAELAQDYIRFLYSPVAQTIIAEQHLRPVDWAKDPRFTPMQLLRPLDPQHQLGSWHDIQQRFFAEGGLIDQIYQDMQ
jgi:sulfate transport system substrate-binding protein